VKLLYYSMLKNACMLLAHKIVFSDEAKTTEVKKKKLTYDIRTIIGQRERLEEIKEEKREKHAPDKRRILDR